MMCIFRLFRGESFLLVHLGCTPQTERRQVDLCSYSIPSTVQQGNVFR